MYIIDDNSIFNHKNRQITTEEERLNHEKTKTEVQTADKSHTTITTVEKKAATEGKMKKELESQKAIVDTKIQTEFEIQRLAAENVRRNRKEKLAKRKSCRRKIISGIILLILLVLITLIASVGISVQPGTTTNYPYITTYNIWFPIDELIDIGGHKLIVFFDDNEMMFSFDSSVTKLVNNDPITIDERIATLTTLFDKVLISTINYKITLEYQGNTAENQTCFKMFIQSDRTIPEFVVDLVLPKKIIAKPA